MANNWLYNPNYPPPPVPTPAPYYPNPYYNSDGNNGQYYPTPCPTSYAPPVTFNVPPPNYYPQNQYSNQVPTPQYHQAPTGATLPYYGGHSNPAGVVTGNSAHSYNYNDDLKSYKETKTAYEHKESYTWHSDNRNSERYGRYRGRSRERSSSIRR